MNKQQILDELLAIRKMMDDNYITSWVPSLEDTIESITLNDYTYQMDDGFEPDDREDVKYNEWDKRIDSLIKTLQDEED
jgi:hypothetical protein